MKRKIYSLLLALLLLLSLAACGGQQDSKPTGGTSQGSSGKLEKPKKDDPARSDATETPDVTPAADPDAPFAYSDRAEAAIDDLFARRDWGTLLAASYLGYREEGDTTDLTAWLHNESPALAAFWPFLTEIPKEDIIGDHGYLYCIVPLEESTPLTVKSVEWEYEGNGATPHYSDPLYDCEVGKPFLLYTACETWLDDSDVVIEFEEDGYERIWNPSLEPDDGTISNPESQYGGDLILDFTHLYDVGDYIPRLQEGTGSEWPVPTALDLADTTWYSGNGWMLEFGGCDESGTGYMVLYQPTDGGGFSPYFDSTWWIEDGCLCLGYYDGNCPFPLRISPVGGQLAVMKSEDGSVLPFFEKEQTNITLTLSYG